ISEVCRAFVALCRELDLLSAATVAIDGSKFKAVNARDKNFTEAKMKRRLERIDESIARYMAQLETADRHGDAVPQAKVARLKDKARSGHSEMLISQPGYTRSSLPYLLLNDDGECEAKRRAL